MRGIDKAAWGEAASVSQDRQGDPSLSFGALRCLLSHTILQGEWRGWVGAWARSCEEQLEKPICRLEAGGVGVA